MLNSATTSPVKEGTYKITQGTITVYYQLNGDLHRIKSVAAPLLLVVTNADAHLQIQGLEQARVEYHSNFNSDMRFDISPNQVLNAEQLVHQFKSVYYTMNNLLGEVPPGFIESAIQIGKFINLDNQQTLFQQGSQSDSVYFLINGKLDVISDNESSKRIVGHIARGEILGEMGVLNKTRRTTTIVAARHSELLQIDGQVFINLLQQYPSVNQFITSTLIRRLDNKNKQKRPLPKPLTRVMIPLNNALDLDWLTTAINTKSRLITLNDVTSACNSESINDINSEDLYRTLQQMEQTQTVCHYWCSPKDSEWLHLCLSRADEIWLCCHHTGVNSEAASLLERLSVQPRWDGLEKNLLIEQQDLTKIVNTHDLLTLTQCRRHYHYQQQHRPSQQRLIRYLNNTSVGLVLGGGGARGAAHVGLFEALKELHINVDSIGGTSIGSIMAACIAMNMSVDTIKEHLRSYFVSMNPLGEYSIPFFSLAKSRRIDKGLQKLFGGIHIEDLPIPFYCVSSNISQANEQVYTRGPLDKALRASIATPGVLPPAIEQGEFFVDGGLTNNLPTDIMAKAEIGTLIAHDVCDNRPLVSELKQMPSNRSYLWRWLLGKPLDVPSITEILFRSTTLAGKDRAVENKKLADIYLQPQLAQYSMLEFNKADEILNIGYQHALKAIDLSQFAK